MKPTQTAQHTALSAWINACYAIASDKEWGLAKNRECAYSQQEGKPASVFTSQKYAVNAVGSIEACYSRHPRCRRPYDALNASTVVTATGTGVSQYIYLETNPYLYISLLE